MRDWTVAIRDRLASGHGSPLATDVIEEIAQHFADLHRAALIDGRSDDEIEALLSAELDKIPSMADSIRRRKQADRAAAERHDARWWSGITRDLSHAVRLLAARRGYSAVVILTLAVGIGGCAAVFSLFKALLLTPLPYPQPDRLVLLWETDADDRSRHFIVSAPNYVDWRSGARSFAALGIWEQLIFNLAATGDPEQISGIRASSSLFDVLGVAPALGRVFTPDEDDPGHHVAVISDAIWRVHYGADPSTVGRSVRLNGQVFEIVGVMPPGFEFPYKGTGVWTPLALTRQDQERGSHSFHVAGRLAEGMSFEQARDEMERLGATLRAQHVENAGEGATVQRMADFGILNTRRILVALSGAVALVLLIACINVASLQLASGLARRREFVTRLSLGASRIHLGRQVFVEALVVAALGCGGGLGLAFMVIRGVDAILSAGFRNLPFRGEVAVTLDGAVLQFAAMTSIATAVVFGFAPLLGLRHGSLQLLLREGDRGATRLAAGTRRLLVTVEIALAIVVLGSAGVMIRSLATLLQVNPGFESAHVLVMRVSLPQTDTYGPPERDLFCTDLASEVGAVPGILRASAVSHLPLSGANASRAITIEGWPQPAPNEGPSANYRLACPGYFGTLGLPLIAGRDFAAGDVVNGDQVVIVNRALVDRYWPNGDALGKRIKIGGFQSLNPWMTIVGIVDNVRHFGLESAPGREIFRPYSQAAWPVMTIVAKTAGEPMLWQRAIRERLRRVELDLPAANARSMDDVMNGSVAWRATPMRLLTGFAVVGLLLAGIGVYGVLAYYVSQRTRELGVRVALGASKQTLIGLVLKQSVIPLGLGIAIGTAGAIASGRWLSELLYEVKPGDPIVLGTVAMLLIFVALASSWLPARRAAMADPMVALRDE